jgi:2-aminoethylphosphonate-pyruvate transaminase
MILLNPGPVNLSSGVRAALAGPDLCHREPEFSALQDTIRDGLLAVYALPPQDWAAVLIAGSGTSSVEAMLTSVVPRDGMLLVIENGVNGERMTRMATVHGIPCRRVSHAWGAAIDLDAVKQAFDAQEGITHVAVVHHETNTGRKNDLAQLGSLARTYGAQLLVDAVSSFGAEALECDEWNIAACSGTANKCLHGAPGVSFATVRREALFSPKVDARTLYLDLANACREQDRHSTAFTQPIHVMHAFAKALEEFREEGGWRSRHAQYSRLARAVREGLGKLGVEALLPVRESSVVLNGYRVPDAIDYEALHDGLKERGFVIYAGQGQYRDNLFRVSTMGAITSADIEQLLVAFRELLPSAGGASGRHPGDGRNPGRV